MVGMCLTRPHQLTRVVAVSPGADTSTDDHGRSVACELLAQFAQQLDRLAIRGIQVLLRITYLCCPVRTSPPGRRLEDEAHTAVSSDLGMASEVASERFCALRILQEVKGREIRQVVAVMKDERGLYAAVSQEDSTIQL